MNGQPVTDRRRAAGVVRRHPAPGRGGARCDAAAVAGSGAQRRTDATAAEPTWWWVHIVGRLKPGATLEQVRGNLDGVFHQAARAGMAQLRKRPDRRAARRCSRINGAGTTCRRCSSRAARTASTTSTRLVIAFGLDPLGRRRARAPDRVRERRQPAAVARDRAPQGALGPPVGRRDARAAGAPAPDRESRALRPRRRRSASCWVTGAGQLLPFGQEVPIDWRVFGFVAGLSVLSGVTFGLVPAFPRHASGSRRRHEGEQPQRQRHAQPARQGAARRASRDFARAARRRRPVPSHAEQPARRGHRLQSRQPADVRRQPAAEPLRAGSDAPGVSSSSRTSSLPSRASGRWP